MHRQRLGGEGVMINRVPTVVQCFTGNLLTNLLKAVCFYVSVVVEISQFR